MTDAKRHSNIVLAICCLAQFLVILDVSVVNVALPSIEHGLDIEASDLHWVLNAYSLAFGGFLLVGGRAADIFGRREVFLVGLVILAAGSLVGGAARSDAMLIAARAVQGLGAAAIAPTSLSILLVIFREGTERTRALAAWGAIGSIGGASGLLIGGLLTDAISWRWVLLINVPVSVALIAATLIFIGATERDHDTRHYADVPGAIAITTGMLALIFAIAGTEEHGWFSGRTLTTFAVGVVLIALFVVIEARFATVPMIPLSKLRSRTLSGAGVVVFFFGAAAFSMWVTLSLYSQGVLGYTALQTGLVMVVPTMAVVLASQVARRLADRFGAARVLAGGLTLLATGLAGLSRVSADGPLLLELYLPSILAGTGLGLSYVPVTVVGGQGVAARDSGLAAGILNAGRQMGAALGIALLTTLAVQHAEDLAGSAPRAQALAEGYGYAFAGAAMFAAGGALVTLFVLVLGVPRRVARAVEL